MSNFGFTGLRVVNPYEVAFREARSAVGAGAVMEAAGQFGTVGEAVADCTLVVGATGTAHREIEHPLHRLEPGGRLLARHLETGRAALLFGSEKFGLSNDDLSHCHWLLNIPTREGHPSMNLGQAVAVCLYELIRDPRVAARRGKKPAEATAQQNELFFELLWEILVESGYVKERTAGSSRRKMRQMVLRLNLSARDAWVWLGIWRQMLWRLGKEPPPDSAGR